MRRFVAGFAALALLSLASLPALAAACCAQVSPAHGCCAKSKAATEALRLGKAPCCKAAPMAAPSSPRQALAAIDTTVVATPPPVAVTLVVPVPTRASFALPATPVLPRSLGPPLRLRI